MYKKKFKNAKNAVIAKLDSDDLKAIKGLMEVMIDEPIEPKLVTKEEQSVQSHQLSDHTDRIERIESRLGITSH